MPAVKAGQGLGQLGSPILTLAWASYGLLTAKMKSIFFPQKDQNKGNLSVTPAVKCILDF